MCEWLKKHGTDGSNPIRNARHGKWHIRRDGLRWAWSGVKSLFDLESLAYDWDRRKPLTPGQTVTAWFGRVEGIIIILLQFVPFLWIDEGEINRFRNLRFSWKAY
jgi:hypothetical protein